MNKQGQTSMFNMYTFFIIIIIVIGAGLLLAVGTAVVKQLGETLFPAIQSSTEVSLGSDAANTVSIGSSITNFIPVITGVLYAVALVGILVLAYGYRMSGERYLLALYFLMVLVILFLSILASNAYQNLYESGGPLAEQLQSQTLLSFLILYSPMILTVLLFVGAIIMFSGIEEVGIA